MAKGNILVVEDRLHQSALFFKQRLGPCFLGGLGHDAQDRAWQKSWDSAKLSSNIVPK